jgi:hypothetical protein
LFCVFWFSMLCVACVAIEFFLCILCRCACFLCVKVPQFVSTCNAWGTFWHGCWVTRWVRPYFWSLSHCIKKTRKATQFWNCCINSSTRVD